MEHKTKVKAEASNQEITIEREFELPVSLLFRAFTEAEFLEQWMGTKVIKLQSGSQGSYIFETTDPKGNVHRFSGVIHTCQNDSLIVRTFEMENTPFDVQLEFLEFKAISENSSTLRMQVIFRSYALRDQILQLPFKQGINMAHQRLEDLMKNATAKQ